MVCNFIFDCVTVKTENRVLSNFCLALHHAIFIALVITTNIQELVRMTHAGKMLIKFRKIP